MKERIRQIMEAENLTSANFAERVQISRASVSHILNGRNNPSLEVVTRILNEMNYINPEWLINGTGSMYKEGVDPNSIPKEPDLFNPPVEKIDPSPSSNQISRGNEVNALEASLREVAARALENVSRDVAAHASKVSPREAAPQGFEGAPQASDAAPSATSGVNKPDKEISQIIVYFTDHTFKVFKP
ncbi:MAG: helix-turn-helix transcriptional regulator [Bacteroidota bacterium]|jgi:transcriptional regulator with XRE-family HTH domain|nr:helix-turn-helix transcriptional regulator [Bacteroidota bacterium]HHU97060.1 helix-turn-helix domain-containing protein [Petrimonas sp.]